MVQPVAPNTDLSMVAWHITTGGIRRSVCQQDRAKYLRTSREGVSILQLDTSSEEDVRRGGSMNGDGKGRGRT